MARTKRRWLIEWTESCPLDECGDAILDAAVKKEEIFPTKAKALKRLKEIAKKRLDFFGVPRIVLEELGTDCGRPCWCLSEMYEWCNETFDGKMGLVRI